MIHIWIISEHVSRFNFSGRQQCLMMSSVTTSEVKTLWQCYTSMCICLFFSILDSYSPRNFLIFSESKQQVSFTVIWHHDSALKSTFYTQHSIFFYSFRLMKDMLNDRVSQIQSWQTSSLARAHHQELADSSCQQDTSRAECHWCSALLNSMRWSEVMHLPGLTLQI